MRTSTTSASASPSGRIADGKKLDDPVINISGLNMDFPDGAPGTGAYNMPTIEDAEQHLGLTNVRVFDTVGEAPLDENAEALAAQSVAALEEAIASGDSDARLTYVGHSMGGLIAERVIDAYGDQPLSDGRPLRDHLEGVVAIQSPFRGAIADMFAFVRGPAVADMQVTARLSYNQGSGADAMDGVDVSTIGTDINPLWFPHGDAWVEPSSTVPVSGEVHARTYENAQNNWELMYAPAGHMGFIGRGRNRDRPAPPEATELVEEAINDVFSR
jgi:pimeloyl-ACP methyl ester carboxylesterase